MALTNLTKPRARWATFKLKVAKAVSRSLYDKLLDQGVSVKDFGAKGDGLSDDTQSFQLAMDYANVIGANLKIPKSRSPYLLDTMTSDYYISMKPNVSILMEEGAIVKAGTNYNSGTIKLNAIFSHVDRSINLGDITIKGEFDFNGSNNLVTDYNRTKNAAVSILHANTVVIDIKATNHPGRQIVQAGDTANTIKTVIVDRLECENVGAGLAGNTKQTDHSSIYAVCDDLIVKSLSVKNEVEPPHTVTALETHARRTSASNFHTTNVSISLIVAAYEQSIESVVVDNSVLKGDQLLNTWTDTNKTIGSIQVGSSNIFTKTFGTLSVVDLSTNMKGTGNNVSIGAMSFNNTKTSNYSITPVVLLGRWRTTSIGKCVVSKCDARFVQAGSIQDNNSSLYIEGAITEHTNQNSLAGYSQLIRLSGSHAFATVQIGRMKSNPKSGTSSATTGISVECPIATKMDIVDNDFSGTISTDIFNNTSPSSAETFYVRHRGNLVPAGGLKASSGSEVLLESNGNRYVLESHGTDWKLHTPSYRTSVGNPTGAILPNRIGEELLGNNGATWYKSTGLTNADWVAIN